MAVTTLVLTFDNLGEASELERGTWDGSSPLGEHPSVTVALPRLLDELASHGLHGTFFAEAINTELNPGALREIAARGHEIGAHGWRHEAWGRVDDAREEGLLARAAEAYAAHDLHVTGFRPPGGQMNAHTAERLRGLGYRWCSPAGDDAGPRDGLTYVPFDWELVDAYHLMDRFGPLREEREGRPEARSATEAAERIGAVLDARGGVQTLILHPFLMLDEAWWEQVRALLARLARLAATGRVRVLPGAAVAAELAEATG